MKTKLLTLLLAGLCAAPGIASINFSPAARNARASALNTTFGATPLLNLYTGAKSSTCASSAPSGQSASISLPSSAFAAPSSGVMALAGTWSGTASATGTIASFRIYESTNTTCEMQGTVTISGGGGDLTLDNPAVVTGQTINISSFSITEGNAFRFVRAAAPVAVR